MHEGNNRVTVESQTRFNEDIMMQGNCKMGLDYNIISNKVPRG